MSALGYATRLAIAIHAKHYAEVTQWKPLPDLLGVLTQIDNMTSGLIRAPLSAQPATEPTEHPDTRRLNHLQTRGATVDLVNIASRGVDLHFRVGGLYRSMSHDLRTAIDFSIAIRAADDFTRN